MLYIHTRSRIRWEIAVFICLAIANLEGKNFTILEFLLFYFELLRLYL
jgi:hypothetical protein